MAAVVGRQRSASESEVPLYCSSYGRVRRRSSTIDYEKGKDKLAFWIGSWDSEKVCGLLQSLVARCSIQQLGYLWTALESVPHRDFLNSLEGTNTLKSFKPLSSPISREVTLKLARSTMPHNKRLYRAQSKVINSQVATPSLFTFQSDGQVDDSRPTSEATCVSKLPGLRDSTPSLCRPHTNGTHSSIFLRKDEGLLPLISIQGLSLKSQTPITRSVSTPLSRVKSPVRRHMLQSGDAFTVEPTPIKRRSITPCIAPKRAFMAASPPLSTQESTLSPETLHFLLWFIEIQAWQQRELLQLLVANLDHKELYFLATLLMSRQYRDFVSHLPEPLVVMVMAYVPAKDILRRCCLVSKSWGLRCSSETVWKRKVEQRRMGLPLSNFLSWKTLYLDDLRLKRNWARGVCATKDLQSCACKVLCLQLRDGVLVTGGADKAVRVWKLSTGECVCKLSGHLKAVWSVCFYGKSFVISGSGDCSVKVWNYRTGVCERVLTGHKGAIWALQQKGEVLISGANDKMGIIWDIRRCEIQVILEGHQGGVFGVDLDQEGRTAFTASGDKSVRQWDVVSGVCLRAARVNEIHPVMALHWDQGYLALGCGDVVMLWDANCVELVGEFKGHEERVETVQLKVYNNSPLVRGVILSSSQDKTIKYWDIKRYIDVN